MRCRLCLGVFANLLNLFDEETHELTKANILQQHFWFELTPNDPISTYICPMCWMKVIDFHQFYKIVEAAHSALRAIGLHEASAKTPAVKTESVANDSVVEEDPLEFIIKEEFIDEESCEEFQVTKDANQEPPEALPTAIELKNVKHRFTEDNNEKPTVGYKGKELRINKAELVKKQIVMGCELCAGFIGDDFGEIIEHFKLYHGDIGPYIRCCGQKLTNNTTIVQHAKQHEDPEPFKFPDEKIFKRHVELHPICAKEHRNKACHATAPRVTCPIQGCNTSVAKRNLKRHMQVHEKLTKCDKCDKMLKPKGLKAHYEIVHNARKPFSCGFCGKKFPSRFNVKEHESTHTGVPLHRCRFCERSFNFKCNMHKHMTIMHNERFEAWRKSKEQKLEVPKDQTSMASTSMEPCSQLLDT